MKHPNELTDEEVLEFFAKDFVGSDAMPQHWRSLLRRGLQILARKHLKDLQHS